MPELGGPGGPPIFGRSVNPIPTGEGRLSPPITTAPTPQCFSPSGITADGPLMSQFWSEDFAIDISSTWCTTYILYITGAPVAFKTWWGHQYRVGIYCPHWLRGLKGGCQNLDTSSCPHAHWRACITLSVLQHLLCSFLWRTFLDKIKCFFNEEM